MDPQRQSWEQSAERMVARIVVGLALFAIAVYVGYRYGITLWDWLKLLVVPAVIAGGGIWFNHQQRERELEMAERRTQDEALQAYLDQMSEMLVPNKDQPSLYKARPGDSLSFVARARTLTVLSRLDDERKARVVQFLYESDLISSANPVLDLSGADLRGIDLSRAFLVGAYLHGVNLKEANLLGVHLVTANLLGADLREADLREASLEGADLGAADLREANLSGAYLRRADLRAADLSRASLIGTYLLGTNLLGASGWTEEQLSAAMTLEEATMPDGKILRGKANPDGPTFDEWAKDK